MGKKGGGSQTTTTSLDPATQDRIKQLWGMAGQSAEAPRPGMDPLVSGAGDMYGQAMGAGNLGFGALSGDQGSIDKLMNPYNSGVIDRVMGDAGRLRAGTMSDVNSAATAAGAFGGSRHGVATGTALADVDRGLLDTVAGLRKGGYDDAMTRAGGLANLGMGAAGAGANLGFARRDAAIADDPAMRRFQAYLQTMGVSPGGTVTKGTTTEGHNPFSGALGGAAAGAQFGPWGAGIGGLLGLFS